MTRPSLILLLAASVSSPAAAQSSGEAVRSRPIKAAFTVKIGDVRLLDDSQMIADNERVFARTSSDVYAFEGEGIPEGKTENLSFGGEILRYKNRFRRADAATGEFQNTMYTVAFMAKSKYYFLPGSAWQPYLGGGIGWVTAQDLDGPIRGVADRLGYQGVVGMQLRLGRVALRVEYMRLHGRVPDNAGFKVDASSKGGFVGLSFLFGPR